MPQQTVRKVRRRLVAVSKQLIPAQFRQLLQPRRLRAYGIGAPKTGTMTLDAMLGDHVRSGHEVNHPAFHRFLDEHLDVPATDPRIIRYLIARDKQIWLEFEAAWFLGHVIEALQFAFPGSKYIVTVREPYAWLDSMLNAIHNFASPAQRALRPESFDWVRLSCRPEKFGFTAFDAPLEEAGLIPLTSLLEFHQNHYGRIERVLPAESCLVIKTEELSQRWTDVANFLGIDMPARHTIESARANVAPRRYNLLSLVNRKYLEEMVNRYCSRLIEEFYPESTQCPDTLLDLDAGGRRL